MEVLGENPPPLPPKTKKSVQTQETGENESKMKISNGFRLIESQSTASQNDSLRIVNKRHREENSSSPPQFFQVAECKVTDSQSDKVQGDERVSSAGKNESGFSEAKNDTFGTRITTWAVTKMKGDDHQMSRDLYENVYNGGVSYLEDRLKSIAEKASSPDAAAIKNEKSGVAEKKQGRRKTPKIEVRQEDNKTVVKISIKETPTPEEEMSGESNFQLFKENVYENGYQNANGFTSFDSNVVYPKSNASTEDDLIYENANVLVEEERCYENLSSGCYENVEPDERFYVNVNEPVGYGGRALKKELITEANYCNLNKENSGGDQVYKNREFQISKNNVVSIISKNSSPSAKNSPEREDKDDESYKSIKSDCHIYANENLYRNGQKNIEKCDETAEKIESRKKSKAETERKSSVVEVFLQKPATAVKVEKSEAELGEMNNFDNNSSGDPFDSGTSSDLDSLPMFVQSKKGNVIVTIKSLQNEDKTDDMKKSESGHRRAESLTSSGVGVDSEESDDEKSNISCDSLNSNEPYAQSNSEDHGYHTPNSEDKTGSPIDQMEYENVIKESTPNFKMMQDTERIDFPSEDYCEKTDIIQQVADASQKIKNLRAESNGVYLAKLIESCSFEDYENVHMLENVPKMHKKKPAPPPPPKTSLVNLKKFSEDVEDKDNQMSLPTNLLQDIRSRSVRLSSTFPNGEKPEGVKNSVADAIFNLKVNSPNQVKSAGKKLDKVSENEVNKLKVEERTYEERKTEVRNVRVNNICAMEVNTDNFYKFHLAENVREMGKENENGEEETFAGIKDYLSREKPAAITSAKGTIRGVKNRVKAGIATFLQLHENKTYKDKDAGKVVVYTTTMGIVRETYHKCLKVKQILRTLMIKFEERDVFMSSEAQEEIRERMKCNVIMVPQVFVEGQHIGDAETIERLNEMGELRTILKPYKSADACSTCKVCGGYRLLPCNVCKGSKKSIHRNHFTAEFVALKCMNCDQVGLTKCYAC